MIRPSAFRWLCGLILVLCTSWTSSYAQNFQTFVSSAGNDGADCFTATTACRSFSRALSQTDSAGIISVLNVGDYGGVEITKSVSIVNDNGGTASIAGSANGTGSTFGSIYVNAGATDVITLRGLTLRGFGAGISGVLINNAQRVNIENCIILNAPNPGIFVDPGLQPATLAPNMEVNIKDTTIEDSVSGIKVASTSGVTVSVSISRSHVVNNTGGGVRIDATGGGAITATIVDSVIGLNGGNGVNAVSGSGAVLANLTNDTIGSNAGAAVQSNGGSATVTVSRSTLSNNGSAWSVVGGATLLSFKNNEVTGPTGSVPSPASFQ